MLGKLAETIAILAIVIACMGLLGVVSYATLLARAGGLLGLLQQLIRCRVADTGRIQMDCSFAGLRPRQESGSLFEQADGGALAGCGDPYPLSACLDQPGCCNAEGRV